MLFGYSSAAVSILERFFSCHVSKSLLVVGSLNLSDAACLLLNGIDFNLGAFFLLQKPSFQSMVKRTPDIELVLQDWSWWIMKDLPFAYIVSSLVYFYQNQNCQLGSKE